MVFEEFCDSELWIRNQTWDTDSPDFTPCFVKTALSWFPSAVLLFMAPIEFWLFHLASDHRRIAPNPYNVAKALLTAAAAACALAEFLLTIVADGDPPPVRLLYACILIP